MEKVELVNKNGVSAHVEEDAVKAWEDMPGQNWRRVKAPKKPAKKADFVEHDEGPQDGEEG